MGECRVSSWCVSSCSRSRAAGSWLRSTVCFRRVDRSGLFSPPVVGTWGRPCSRGSVLLESSAAVAIDLSIGAIVAFAGAVFGVLVHRGFGPWTCFAACFASAWGLSIANSFVLRWTGVPAIIVTIAGLSGVPRARADSRRCGRGGVQWEHHRFGECVPRPGCRLGGPDRDRGSRHWRCGLVRSRRRRELGSLSAIPKRRVGFKGSILRESCTEHTSSADSFWVGRRFFMSRNFRRSSPRDSDWVSSSR